MLQITHHKSTRLIIFASLIGIVACLTTLSLTQPKGSDFYLQHPETLPSGTKHGFFVPLGGTLRCDLKKVNKEQLNEMFGNGSGRINYRKIHRIIFAELDSLSPEIARILADYNCNLVFPKIESVSSEVIDELRPLKKSIVFQSLINIDIETAKSMKLLSCDTLVLGNVSSLSDEVAYYIYSSSAQLGFPALTEVGPRFVDIVSNNYKGRSIGFSNAKRLSTSEQERIKKAGFDYYQPDSDICCGFHITSKKPFPQGKK